MAKREEKLSGGNRLELFERTRRKMHRITNSNGPFVCAPEPQSFKSVILFILLLLLLLLLLFFFILGRRNCFALIYFGNEGFRLINWRFKLSFLIYFTDHARLEFAESSFFVCLISVLFKKKDRRLW